MRKAVLMCIVAFCHSCRRVFSSQTQNPNSNDAKSTQVIEVVTKKYESSPDQIHVKKCTTVQLILRTLHTA
jgi:hypothetical protein